MSGLEIPCVVNVIKFEETRQVNVMCDEAGRCIDSKPVEGSERAFLDLELPGGAVVRAEVSWKDFNEHVTPAFGKNQTV